MKSSLREQFEFLAQRPAARPVVSGSPVTLKLRVPFNHRVPLRIVIIKLMAQQGITLLEAHTLMGELLQACSITKTFPGVSDLPGLIEELAKADVTTTVVEPALVG